MRTLTRYTWRRPQRRHLVRGRDPRFYGATGAVTFPTTPLNVQVRIALGADLTADPATWVWQEISEYVRYETAIFIQQWRQDESATTTPSSARLTLDNRDGRFSRRNPTGPYYGLLSKNTPIWISVDPGDGMHTRFEGFVNAWPNRWDITLSDDTVPIECAGVLRRLSQGSRPMSAMRRTILAANPEAYWPLEEGPGATFAESGVGGPRIPAGLVEFGQFTDLVSASRTPNMSAASLSANTSLAGLTDDDGWHVEFAIKSGFVTPLVARVTTQSSTNPTLEIFYPSVAGDAVEVTILDSTGALVDTMTGTAVAATWVEDWHHIAVVAEQILAQATFELWVDGVREATGAGAGASTINQPVSVQLNPSLGDVTSMAHLVVANGIALTGYEAFTGHAGEQAHTRIERLCGEAGVRYFSLASESVAMGPQSTGTLVEQLREPEAADHGTLYERGWGLAYASRAERENQATAVLALDIDASDLSPSPETTDDDQRTRNLWVVTSTSTGAEATYEQTTGPTGTGVDGPGIYDDSTSLNVELDTDLLGQASYLVHLGTVDEDRWPLIPVALHRRPEFIGDVCSLVPGSRTTVANPPDQMAPDMIDTIVEGYLERFDQFLWNVALVTSPNSPHHVFRLAETSGDMDPFVGYLTPTTCVLAEDLDTSEPGVDITTDPLWSTDSDDWTPGAQVVVGGEVMLVTAVSGASNPQTLTVTRSVNGVVKTHASGAAVEFLSPGVPGL